MKHTLTVLITLFSTMAAPVDAKSEEKPDSIRVFYFGNSLTGSAIPDFHEQLGKGAKKTWICDAFLGAGWQSWQHRNELWRAMGRTVDAETQSASSRGDLTLDDDLAKSAPFKPKKFFGGGWDAIVIQIFGSKLHNVTDSMWGSKFDGPVDVGDVAAASDIIRTFLKKNPQGKVFIYTVWPNMQSGQIPPDDQLPNWAIEMKETSGVMAQRLSVVLKCGPDTPRQAGISPAHNHPVYYPDSVCQVPRCVKGLRPCSRVSGGAKPTIMAVVAR